MLRNCRKLVANRIALLMLAILWSATVFAADGPAVERPNIVLIVADDLGVNDLSCYGRRDQPTPNLDRLAQQGLRFTSAYAAASICSPTRAALMTGKSPARLHITTFLPGRGDAPSQLLLHPRIEQQLPLSEVTIAERLKAEGYTSACIGKWHLGGKGFLPTDQGFDVYHAGRANTPPSAGEGGKGEYDLTTAAEKFVEANRDKPFFLYVAHNNPHVPLAARADLVEQRKAAFNPVYAAMIGTLDDSVGRLVAKIDSLGLGKRTLVVFTSDNGGLHVQELPQTPATHNTPFRAGKGFSYEGGLRIPLIARWTGTIRAGDVVDTPVISTDWAPTLMSVARPNTRSNPGNAAPPDQAGTGFEGADLYPLLARHEELAPRPLYWHMPHYTNQGGRPFGAIREGSWKLIEHYEDGRLELFHVDGDSSEVQDVAHQSPARVAELRGKLEVWRRAVAAQDNAANPNFNGATWRKLYSDIDVSSLPLLPHATEMAEKLIPWRTLMNSVLRPASPEAVAGAGAVILHARDAKVHGSKLRYEPQPQKDTLGFWVQQEDRVEWQFDAPHAGLFELEALQGCGTKSGGAEVEFTVAGEKSAPQSLVMKVEETGHFQRFIPRRLGVIRIEHAGPHTLTVAAKTKPGVAVMDLRRVTLRSRD